MNYALFLTAYSEVRKVREYATFAEAEQAAAEEHRTITSYRYGERSNAS